ncbi:MAG: SlyX family protein [Lentisphaeria bacterium]|nr:SlyX family protein [Lentisphaeria bacterium]
MEENLVEFELKLAFQDKLIDDLNEVVLELREHVERLDAEVRALRDEMKTGLQQVQLPANEKPPHY